MGGVSCLSTIRIHQNSTLELLKDADSKCLENLGATSPSHQKYVRLEANDECIIVTTAQYSYRWRFYYPGTEVNMGNYKTEPFFR
jgi:hypothetical protein